MGVNLRIDGLMVLTAAALAGGAVLYVNRGKLLNLVNPTSSQNVAYQGAAALGDVVGIPDTDERGIPLDDYVFAALDQINPFNESDVYSDFVIWGKEVSPDPVIQPYTKGGEF